MATSAQPGNVQAALDSAAGGGSTATVGLVPNQTYEVGSPWRVRQGTVLDCTGARITGGSSPIIRVEAGGGLRNPFVDQRGRGGWSGAAIEVSTQNGAVAGRGGVWNAFLLGGYPADVSGQVGIHLNDSAGAGISNLRVTGYMFNFNHSVRVSGGSVTNNWLWVTAWAPGTGIHHADANDISGNEYICQLQTILEGDTNWMWDLGSGSSSNTMYAVPWDPQHIAGNRSTWRFRAGCGPDNVVIDEMGEQTAGMARAVNESSSQQYIVNWADVGTSV